MTKADELRAIADEMKRTGRGLTAPNMIRAADIIDQMAQALALSDREFERLGKLVGPRIYVRAALRAAGYEVK